MMKRALTVFMLAAFLFASTTPLIAQKTVRSLTKEQPGKADRLREDRNLRFISTAAFSSGDGTWIEWRTENDTDVVGFYVFRVSGKSRELIGGDLVKGPKLLPGGVPTDGGEFGVYDPDGTLDSAYEIETVTQSTRRSRSDLVFAQYVSDISAAAGESESELLRRTLTRPATPESQDLAMTKELITENEESRPLADINTHRWVVGQPAAKIGVKFDGLYRVTRAELQNAGFDTSTNPNLWQLYLEGVEQPAIVHPSGDYIEFYGKGLDTQESDTRMYYLITGPSAGRRMNTRVMTTTTSPVYARSYSQTYVKKERTNYLYDILNGDAENYWGRVVASNPSTFTFDISGIDTAAAQVVLAVNFQGYSGTLHNISLTLNGQPLAPATGNGFTPYSAVYTLPPSALVEGTNSLLMASGATNDVSFFDRVSVSFDRRHVAVQNKLSFYTQNYRGARVEGFSSPNIRAFDVTLDGEPVQMVNLRVQPNGAGHELAIPAGRGRVYYAVEDSGVLAAASVTANIPSTLATAANNAALIIIAYKDWMAEAEAWANYRRGQGFTAKVVNVEDVYDEFGYGVKSPESLRDFLQFAENNWQTPPQYILLIGDATYDPRHYEANLPFADWVPTKIASTVFTETPSDDALVDFNNDGLGEIAIGRVPARTPAEVSSTLAKVAAFEQPSMRLLSRGSLFAYDLPNGYPFNEQSIRLRDRMLAAVPPGETVQTPVMLGRGDANSGVNIINEMNAGKYIVNYAGHGTSGAWAASAFFANSRVPLLTNSNSRSIYTMLTCLNGYFIQLGNRSLAENLLLADNGGASVVWASSGLTTPDIQETMGGRFYEKVASGTIPRVGDLVVDAKSVVTTGGQARLSWVLIGDPMMIVR